MKILFANDSVSSHGGVESYIVPVMRGLRRAGHRIAFVHQGSETSLAFGGLGDTTVWGAGAAGLGAAVEAAGAWRPDVVFSHNVNLLALDSALVAVAPVVKLMHTYAGLCLSHRKMHSFPRREVCTRVLGPACVPLFFARRCGEIQPRKLPLMYDWALEQSALFQRYERTVASSSAMASELLRIGVPAERVAVVPLFAGECHEAPAPAASRRSEVVFAGRMTSLKGGDILIRAVAHLDRRRGTRARLVMVGDGPERPRWEALARRCGVLADFVGWLPRDATNAQMASTRILAVPSVWPEPFGLVGLEASSMGIPSVGFRVGGIPEWLHHERNGLLVSPDGDRATALATAMGRILDDTALEQRLKRGAIEVASELDLARHLRGIEDVFAAAAAAGASSRRQSSHA